ncbi:MAG: acetate--CoA ligase family protein [Pseudomonadota bacterium]
MNKTQVQELINIRLGDSSSSLHVLTEDEAKKVFQLFDIPVVPEIRVEKADQVMDACRKIGFPVVLKGISQQIAHKSEAGLVRVGLNNEDQVKEAIQAMKNRIGKDKIRKDRIDAFLVQPVVEGKREFVAGMFKDQQFGPVIVFGLGGIFTEALNDVVFKLAPLDDTDIQDMFEQLRSKALLGAFRGEKAADKQGLQKLLFGLSDIAANFPDIKEIDINPVIIQPDGAPIAVDGLIVLEKNKKQEKADPVDLKKLASCYYPNSIAFVGASATPGKWGHMLSTSTFSRDFKGQIYLVNPKGGTIVGRPVYSSVEQIEDDIDLAVVTIPANRVMELIPQLEKRKVKGILLITSGFKEIGDQGAALEKEVVSAARKAGILILGPNTMGICNPHAQFYCTASHAYPLPGSTTLVSQSGNMGTQLLNFAEQQDIGIRAFSGSGNEAMVTIEDYMEAFEKDDLTKTVVLYIESVKDGPRFFQSAKRVSNQKPVVVLKGGRTFAGIKAATSHTGAMATDAKIFDAACRQAGIIQVDQPMELLDLSAVFSSLPLPKGKRVAIMTFGGGWGVIAADLCVEHGLEVPELSQEIIGRLNQILPLFWSHGNPVDIVGEGDPDIPKTCMEELIKWEGIDAVIHLGIHGKRILINNMINSASKVQADLDAKTVQFYKDMALQVELDYIRHVGQLTQRYKKPVIGVSLLTDEISKTLYRLEDNEYKGVFFSSPERAVKALSGMCQYTQWKKNYLNK